MMIRCMCRSKALYAAVSFQMAMNQLGMDAPMGARQDHSRWSGDVACSRVQRLISFFAFGGGNPIGRIELDGHMTLEGGGGSSDSSGDGGGFFDGILKLLSGQGDAPKTWTSDGLREPAPATTPNPSVPVSTGDGGDAVGGAVNAATETATVGGGAAISIAMLFGFDPLGDLSRKTNKKLDADTTTNAYAAGGVTFDVVTALMGGAAGKAISKLARVGTNGGGKLLWTSWHEYPKVTADGQTYAKIGERLYSKHAVDRMQPSGLRFSPRPGPDEGGTTGGMPQIFQAGGDYGRSVSPNFIEDVIGSTRGVPQENGNFIHDGGGLQVILSPEGRVVTVMTR